MLMAQVVAAGEAGRDTDASPLQLTLPRIGVTVDTRFLTRRRGEIQTSGTVVG
jgi:hypothetical protein